MKYFLSVGEASGDLHASRLMKALRARDPEAEFIYMGGPRMREQGGVCIRHSEDLAYMGFLDVLRHYPQIRRAAQRVRRVLLQERPDVVVCVDYPGFHLRYILPFVRAHLPQTRLVYYIPPKVWAWKSYRIRQLREQTDLVLCIFPFELPFFRARDLMQAYYVGNPSMEAVSEFDKETISTALVGEPSLALVCGSRKSEIRKALPLMLRVASCFPRYTPVVPMAPGLSSHDFDGIPGIDRARLVEGNTFRVVKQATAALVTSGTATLETALLGTPQVVCYPVAGGVFPNLVFRFFFGVRYISLVNLNADCPLVAELFGSKFRDETVREELAKILPEYADAHPRAEMLQGYRQLRMLLDPERTPSVAAAEKILSLFRNAR